MSAPVLVLRKPELLKLPEESFRQFRSANSIALQLALFDCNTLDDLPAWLADISFFPCTGIASPTMQQAAVAHAVSAAETQLNLFNQSEQIQNLYDQSLFGVAHMDSDGKFHYVNSQLCKVLGYHAQELITKTWFDVTN
ncbi:MAG: PAS domain S-box protein, partial [Anaerolineaceae bacterium]|nr:PAS domain S-box protein [Anaerolineaceae bacterium]